MQRVICERYGLDLSTDFSLVALLSNHSREDLRISTLDGHYSVCVEPGCVRAGDSVLLLGRISSPATYPSFGLAQSPTFEFIALAYTSQKGLSNDEYQFEMPVVLKVKASVPAGHSPTVKAFRTPHGEDAVQEEVDPSQVRLREGYVEISTHCFSYWTIRIWKVQVHLLLKRTPDATEWKLEVHGSRTDFSNGPIYAAIRSDADTIGNYSVEWADAPQPKMEVFLTNSLAQVAADRHYLQPPSLEEQWNPFTHSTAVLEASPFFHPCT